MAKRKTTVKQIKIQDFSSWNFILFLTLSFILLVVLGYAMTQTAQDVRTKAGFICPKLRLPRTEDCMGGWTYQRNSVNGCPTFVCKTK